MILLVCGGRDFSDKEFIYNCLDSVKGKIDLIIEGGANGADRIAREWAVSKGIHFATVEALWGVYSNKAGPLRNKAMLMLKPDACVAFLGGTGTKSMVNLCNASSIKVWEPRQSQGRGKKL